MSRCAIQRQAILTEEVIQSRIEYGLPQKAAKDLMRLPCTKHIGIFGTFDFFLPLESMSILRRRAYIASRDSPSLVFTSAL